MELSSSTFRVLILTIGAILYLLLWVANVFVILYCSKPPKVKPYSESPLGNKFPKLSYAELLQATDKFSPAKLIGKGQYGSVYKGVLSSGKERVAVKVLNLQRSGASKSFLAECEALRNIRHRNLVRIITSCSGVDFSGNDFKALVFEFMPNGTLERWLHPTSSDLVDSKKLNLVQRLNIAIDVACALNYLHHHCRPSIVHCDLKPSNVLLDSEFCAHVGDFGLARFLKVTTNKSNHTQSSSSIGVRGTLGYVPPEYGMGGEVTLQGDVYSFGILLLEMFTRRRPTDGMFKDNFCLHNYVKMALPERVMDIADRHLKLDESTRNNQGNKANRGRKETCLELILRLGLSCSAQLPRERKNIRDVLVELQAIRSSFLGFGRHNIMV